MGTLYKLGASDDYVGAAAPAPAPLPVVTQEQRWKLEALMAKDIEHMANVFKKAELKTRHGKNPGTAERNVRANVMNMGVQLTRWSTLLRSFVLRGYDDDRKPFTYQRWQNVGKSWEKGIADQLGLREEYKWHSFSETAIADTKDAIKTTADAFGEVADVIPTKYKVGAGLALALFAVAVLKR